MNVEDERKRVVNEAELVLTASGSLRRVLAGFYLVHH